ncbi:unnamed protein product [Allacma fusca]|uniref:Uncharacterized protein n=1 Tax=Allacma fusca TaxID=39272 RepID=A0A8J2K9I1_9HEXA|nr:unnamed protein product [Allacma fusca]
MISRAFLTIFFICQIAFKVSGDSDINSFAADSYAVPPSSPPLTNNDQVYNPPGQTYNAPVPTGNYGSYGNVPVLATDSHVGGASTSVSSSQKFNLYGVLAGFKLMVLYVIFVLYKLTYLTDFPNKALSVDQQQQQKRHLDLDIMSVTHQLVTQLLEGDFDVNKLFHGKRPL